VDAGSPEAVAVAGGVDAVVYTHHHPDHIRGSHLVGAPEYSPEGESAYRSLRDLARRFAPGAWREWLSTAATLIGALRVPSGGYYRPGEDVCVRGICLKTAPAPGHLATHTLVELPGRILHLADIDLTSFGPWYGNPESDPLQFLADIELAASWDARLYTTSHRPDTLARPEALRELARYALRLVGQAEAVYRAYESVGGPAAPGELVGRGLVYPRIPRRGRRLYLYFEEVMVSKISGLLAGLNCLRRTRRGYEARGSGCWALDKLRERARGVEAYL